jgi:hypothetical protein
MAEADVAEPTQPFAERVSRWLDWTDAISLAAALDGSPSKPDAPPGAAMSASLEEREFARVRSALVKAIAEDGGADADPGHLNRPATASGAPMDTKADFSGYRRRYVARQQAMEASIGPLRGRLRATLARTSAPLARLAAVDAAMERIVGVHERRLLSTVPRLLEKHFQRLSKADVNEPETSGGVRPGGWLDVFGQDMQGVLLAELEIRLQPVEGLLEALRTKPPAHHE